MDRGFQQDFYKFRREDGILGMIIGSKRSLQLKCFNRCLLTKVFGVFGHIIGALNSAQQPSSTKSVRRS